MVSDNIFRQAVIETSFPDMYMFIIASRNKIVTIATKSSYIGMGLYGVLELGFF
jgi:hypothetical protein